MLVISMVIGMTMPKWQPAHRAPYGQLLKSLANCFAANPYCVSERSIKG
jgi:hypothetical protein